MAKENQNRLMQAAELFWEAIPPIWYMLRSQIDKTAREDFDVTVGHFHMLRRIMDGDTSVSELADARHISRPVVSRKVDSLVEKELITRRESIHDRRYTVLELTPKGERILESLSAASLEWLEGPLGKLNDQELKTVTEAFQILKKISS